MQDKVALIMAGGTGGHVFPALAVAQALRISGVTVHWLGTRAGIEAKVVPQAGFDISYIAIRGLRGNGMLRLLFAPFKLVYATFHALLICLKLKPNFVLGMGGFVTGPGGVASRLLAKPLIIHEQNAIPGFTNIMLSKIATRVLKAFPDAFKSMKKSYHTGNPVRDSILKLATPEQRYSKRDEAIRILIVGGSLGAQALNEVVPQTLSILGSEKKTEIWHQAGRLKSEQTMKAYQDVNLDARVVEFIDDMDTAYGWADLIICRAGAMTVSEICAVGLASILVPYPFAVDDHQTANAAYLVDAGAAVLINQDELSPHTLANELHKLFISGRERLLAMANRAYELARPDATQVVMQHCLEVAR